MVCVCVGEALGALAEGAHHGREGLNFQMICLLKVLIEFPVLMINDGADSNFNMSMISLPVNTP